MPRRGVRLCAALLTLFCAQFAAVASPSDPRRPPSVLSVDAQDVLAMVRSSADNHGLPFAIIDKRAARVYVFDATGQLLGATPGLLGLTPGDDAIPDIASRAPSSLRRDERSTPAGRYDSRPGHNDKGEAIVWVDYAASLAIHRLRPAPAAERRPARMASADPADHRISLGCVIVPVDFYASTVAPTLGAQRGVVYVLPETRPAMALFDRLDRTLARR